MDKEQIKKKGYNGWSFLVIILILISLGLIVFSFYAPSYLVQPSTDTKYDFSQTGQIGDTIGGLMNPFIALAGVIVTFLAFYMQIEANRLQIEIFQEELEEEKRKEERKENVDSYNKLSLLSIDLESILGDLSLKSNWMKEYYEGVKNEPLKTHILYRNVSLNYERILEFDRLSLYKAFKLYLQDKEDWLKLFNLTYNTFDYLPRSLKEIYEMFDKHSKDLFEKKMKVNSDINTAMDLASKLISKYKNGSGQDYLNFPASQLCNEFILKYYDIINQGLDENGNVIAETDLERVQEDVLKYFIEQVLVQREDQVNYDSNLEPIMQLASKIRKDIFSIKNRAFEFANSVERLYNQINIGTEENKSVITIITDLKKNIDEALDKYSHVVNNNMDKPTK